MKTNSILNKPVRWLIWALGLEVILHAAVIVFLKDENLRLILNNILNPLEVLLVTITLYYAARLTATTYPQQAGSWRWWVVAFSFYALGDFSWAVYEIILQEAPFPSIADLFYLMYFVFMWLGLTRFPVDQTSTRERRLVLLDNLIVILGAGLAFWYFLINPLIIATGDVDFITILLAVEYPILDLVIFWALLTFFRNRLQKTSSIPLNFFGFGLFSYVITDVYFAYGSINETFISGSYIDLGWTIGSIFFALAAIAQMKSIFRQRDQSPAVELAKTESFRSWPLYLPYFWMIVSYGVLIANATLNPGFLPIYLAVGIIIGLVVFRQVLTMNDNERLLNQVEWELTERKRIQEDLHLMNLELDQRVQDRTKDIFITNQLLSQTNEKLEETLREKEVLLKEIHHRVKNNLQLISSLLNLQGDKIKDTSTLRALRDSQARVRSMALIHQKLYQSNNIAKIEFGEYAQNLSKDLFRSYQPTLGEVQLKIQVDIIFLDLDTAVPCGLILNELMTNTLKYAFPNGRKGTIWVDLHIDADQTVNLRVADDGMGFPSDLDVANAESLGLQLINSLTKQMDGNLEIENINGTAIRISFKY